MFFYDGMYDYNFVCLNNSTFINVIKKGICVYIRRVNVDVMFIYELCTETKNNAAVPIPNIHQVCRV